VQASDQNWPLGFFAFCQVTECEGELRSGAVLLLELSCEIIPWGFLHSVKWQNVKLSFKVKL